MTKQLTDGDEDWSIAAAVEQLRGTGASATQVARAVAVRWEPIEGRLTAVIGAQGVAALYKRSLLLTSRSYSWLRDAPVVARGSVDPAAFMSMLEQQEPDEAARAGSEFLRTFQGLLAGLIGGSLARRLLR